MKLIVAGGRDYKNIKRALKILDTLHAKYIVITEVVSGCCPTGVDKMGETWAEIESIPIKRFPADWDKHGRAAGPIRYKQMAEHSDILALFPGGKGTTSMYNEAKKADVAIYDFRDEEKSL